MDAMIALTVGITLLTLVCIGLFLYILHLYGKNDFLRKYLAEEQEKRGQLENDVKKAKEEVSLLEASLLRSQARARAGV